MKYLVLFFFFSYNSIKFNRQKCFYYQKGKFYSKEMLPNLVFSMKAMCSKTFNNLFSWVEFWISSWNYLILSNCKKANTLYKGLELSFNWLSVITSVHLKMPLLGIVVYLDHSHLLTAGKASLDMYIKIGTIFIK